VRSEHHEFPVVADHEELKRQDPGHRHEAAPRRRASCSENARRPTRSTSRRRSLLPPECRTQFEAERDKKGAAQERRDEAGVTLIELEAEKSVIFLLSQEDTAEKLESTDRAALDAAVQKN